MNIQQEKISRICLNIGNFENSKYKISVNQLFLALILFDEVILRGGFSDITQLIEILGAERANELIASNCLKFEWDIQAIGLFNGSNTEDISIIRPRIIASADSSKNLENRLDALDMLKNRICIPKKVYSPLKKNIQENLKNKIPKLYEESLENAKSIFLTKNDFIKEGLIFRLNKKYQMDLKTSDLSLEITNQEGDFKVRNNLSSLTRLNGEQIFELIQKSYTSIESPLSALEFSQKNQTFLAQNEFERANFQIGIEELLKIKNAESSLKNLDRVLKIGEVPDFEKYISEIKIDKLLEIRSSDEIGTFRSWINQTKELPEEEIERLLKSIWEKILNAYHDGTGKVLRLVVSSVATPLAGIGLGIFDTFISEKLLKPCAPISFIESGLGSIFPIHATKE